MTGGSTRSLEVVFVLLPGSRDRGQVPMAWVCLLLDFVTGVCCHIVICATL